MTDKPAAAAGTVALGGMLEVNRMGFGAMRLTGEGIWGEPRNVAAARSVLHRAIELGVNFIDTADSYGPEVSEQVIAEALYPYPDDLVIATKGGMTRSGPGQWGRDARPERLKRACEGSLRRLRLERIDLYQLHTVDRDVPIEESLGALWELRKEGKIRYAGVSNVSVDQLERARGVVQVASVQNRYSVGDRASDDVLERCEALGIAFIPWYPLGAGRLAERGGPLDSIAESHGATPSQIALSWLLARSRRMLVIPGTSRLDHLEENVAAAEIELNEQEMGSLER
jgi:aryl-alcohol dehydrogenase-like predicted oxidoreductase